MKKLTQCGMMLPLLILSSCSQHDKKDVDTTTPATASEYYTTWGKEEARLTASPTGQLERIRTESILNRHLPKPPAVLYDIGGGAGAYAFPLAKSGYRVHLIDITPLHIQQAKEYAKSSGINLEECTVGTATSVKAADKSADIVLLLGPLYHLQNKEERLTALKEAMRILKPGGIVFAVAMTRVQVFVHVANKTKLQDETSKTVLLEDIIKLGKSSKPIPGHPIFDSTYFHNPDELVAELQTAGFSDVQLLCLEGPEISKDSLAAIMSDPEALKKFLHLLELVENDRSIMGASGHIMAIAKK